MSLLVAYFALSPIFRDLTPSQFGELTDIAVLGLAALGLNLLIGFTGQISIGHSAFFGVGAYTLAILVKDHGWSPGWTYPVAALICFTIGVLVGVPALRLKGLYLALVTLALAQIFPALIRKFDDLTGGSAGIDGLSYNAPAWTGLDPGRRGRAEWLYWVALGTLALGYLLVRNLVKSRIGRAMVAVRDNPTAASAMGVNVAAVKTIAFGLSAAITGMAGCTFALRQTQTTPENLLFTILGSILFLVIMVVGGAGQPPGSDHRRDRLLPRRPAQPGAPRQDLAPRSVRELPAGTTQPGHPVFSVLLILMMFVAPFGIVGAAKRAGRRFVVVIPAIPVSKTAPAHAAEPAPAAAG